jgi:hypothetical protein
MASPPKIWDLLLGKCLWGNLRLGDRIPPFHHDFPTPFFKVIFQSHWQTSLANVIQGEQRQKRDVAFSAASLFDYTLINSLLRIRL